MSDENPEVKSIWWFQQDRYMDEGWCINQTSFRSHPIYWLFAAIETVFPTAVRRVDV